MNQNFIQKSVTHFLCLAFYITDSPNSSPRDSVHPIVKICVDSPKDEEQKSLAQTPDIEKIILERSSLANSSTAPNNSTESSNVVVNVDEPIDINLAKTCDSSKVIYDY